MDYNLILNTSDEAARFNSKLGMWVSRDGQLFQDEEFARYAGCSHIQCPKCGAIYERQHYCPSCLREREDASWSRMEKKVWDGKGMICDRDGCHYFSDLDEARDFAADQDIELEDLKLVICEPHCLQEIDFEEYFQDDMPEDTALCDIPELESVVNAMTDLNNSIRKAREQGKAVSYFPGKYKVDLTNEPGV